MSYPPHLNRLPQLPPGICPPQFAGFPQGVPAGTPMIPVHMGIMTSAPAVLVPTTVSMVQMPPAPRKELNPVRLKENEEGGGGGPTTTVFVGNISEKASDMLVRQLLAKCGLVLSWKRVQGASGKLQGKNKTAFGFCEYKEPESTLRSLRLLHELLLGDKKLLVKVDAKTKAQLEEWKAKKKIANGGTKSEDGPKEEEDEEEVLDEDTKRRDQIVKGAIEGLIREYGSELNAPSQDGDNQPRKKKREKKEEEDINVMDMEDDKRDLISREISKFRDTHKKLEEEKGKKEQERQEIDKDRRERDKERERERERRDREREKEREKEKERNDNNKERERDRERIDRDRERTRERGDRGERERVKERSREVSKDRSRSRERSRDEKKHEREEDQEEAYERRKLERKMRDKEVAYQERLKNWEMRERKKARDYDKENQREDERRREMVVDNTKEGKRLKEFLEDYDDDKDDLKYYRGSALQKRLRDREKETELDERDRKREKEEHDQIRQRLLAEGHPDPEAELQRMEEEAERRRQPPVKPEPEEEVPQEKPNREREHREREHREREHREREHREREHHRDRRGGGGGGGADRPPLQQLQPQSDDDLEEGEELDDCDREDSSDARPNPNLKPTMRPITSAPSVSSGSGGATPNSPGNESPCGIIIPHENSPEARPTEEQHPKIGLSLKLGAGASPNHQIHTGSKRKKLANVDSVFNKFGEEEADEAPRKRKLVPLDYGEDDKSLGLDGAEVPGGKGGQNTEEKRKHIRSLIEKIPTARPDLFNYPLDWTAVDSTLMERRIRPWINKKIIEYIGEEEATLVDFVCSKVMSHGTPQGILDDVAMVLDEEAEVFIVKMWRLLIYETEAKKIGLGK
ncbi:RNA-binding protein 25 isoform X1 [Salmo salar]|uniref:RNA-binding protein 25 isoform X1 n=1 Tax=Salmo salar TaxID=8030 RepID=A0ABM3F8S4_SALSA|nr:RNA-binding protein 25 isoform X1 [Salmo salar]